MVQGMVQPMTFGDLLPHIPHRPPGPRSRELATRLARVESRNITCIDDAGPIFWAEAAGANVRDVDGNTFIDLTAGFGVAAAGHSNPAVSAAAATQFSRLAHAMGDVHPAEAKIHLLEALARLAPGDLAVSILSANGSDAVESALKTAMLATGRPGVIAFHGSYHGLGYGALSVTAAPRFRRPFERQLFPGVRFVPYPAAPGTGRPDRPTTDETMARIRREVADAGTGAGAVGAVIVEPVQGRGGVVVPPAHFLPALRALCTELDLLLILDEVYTGFGRTGRWFACQHWDVAPDLLVVGKALAGGLPLSAVIGTPAMMDAWPPSQGEALHTSTFLGNPVACAAALAHLGEIERLGLVERSERLGQRVGRRLDGWVGSGRAAAARGLGLMRAAVPAGDNPDESAGAAARTALRHGVLVLSEGDALAITPPLVITEPQLDHALDVIEAALGRS
jgi:4-aminobutyrate aminotransferase-like enzyme